MSHITQLSPTPRSVITLGHMSKEPLIGPSSELVDRFEPHDHILPGLRTACSVMTVPGVGGEGRGVPGVGAGRWVPGGCYTGYQPAADFEAYLMNY